MCEFPETRINTHKNKNHINLCVHEILRTIYVLGCSAEGSPPQTPICSQLTLRERTVVLLRVVCVNL